MFKSEYVLSPMGVRERRARGIQAFLWILFVVIFRYFIASRLFTSCSKYVI